MFHHVWRLPYSTHSLPNPPLLLESLPPSIPTPHHFASSDHAMEEKTQACSTAFFLNPSFGYRPLCFADSIWAILQRRICCGSSLITSVSSKLVPVGETDVIPGVTSEYSLSSLLKDIAVALRLSDLCCSASSKLGLSSLLALATSVPCWSENEVGIISVCAMDIDRLDSDVGLTVVAHASAVNIDAVDRNNGGSDVVPVPISLCTLPICDNVVLSTDIPATSMFVSPLASAINESENVVDLPLEYDSNVEVDLEKDLLLADPPPDM